MPDLNGITFSSNSLFEQIKYKSSSVIDFEGFSSNGIKRHIDYKIVDNKIAFKKSFNFNILKVNSSDITELEAIDGTEVIFQSYDDEPIYSCTCSIKPINRLMEIQKVKGYAITLKVIIEAFP